MGILNNIYLIDNFHTQICRKTTGSPKEFAKKLVVSERKLFRLIEEFRDNGAIIVYNSKKLTYQYNNKVEINVCFKIYK